MSFQSPFDHDSLMYKLMKYLYKIQEQMGSVFYIWTIIDVIQFLTIITSLLGYVIQKHYKIVQEDLFDNVLNIFFNYTKIYDWLVISGACSAFIVLITLLAYIVVEFKKQLKQEIKKKFLTYCALIGTIAIGLFQIFSQVMANNLINIVTKILSKQLKMDVSLIGFFLLNMIMMIFVSVFNSDRRIFRFSLVIVSFGLNMLPFTLTCLLLIVLSFYYQNLDKVVYKKLFYFLIITTCLWSGLQANDPYDYLLTSRIIYLSVGNLGFIIYFLSYEREYLDLEPIEESNYLVDLYLKKISKQDTKQDYLKADQYFVKYFNREREQSLTMHNFSQDYYLTVSCQNWSSEEFKSKIIQKIKNDHQKQSSSLSNSISYYRYLLKMKINMVELLKEVFSFISEKKNQSIYTVYQINKLTNQIQKQFTKNVSQDQELLMIDQIYYLEQLYRSFYKHYEDIVQLLGTIFSTLELKESVITQTTEEKLKQFTVKQKSLERVLNSICIITGKNKLQSKLYEILSEVWDKYEKKQHSQLLNLNRSSSDMKLSAQQSKEKFDFSYVVISNQTIKYASLKFLSAFSYKENYIVGQSSSLIFPLKFNLFITQLLKANEDKKIFSSQILILNQNGMFEVVNSTFYLLPQFKGEITYIMKIKRISQFELKNLFLFNCQTFCIERFNKKFVKNFKFSIQKISTALANGAIQFSDLFIFNNQQKDFLAFTQKAGTSTHRNRRQQHQGNHLQKQKQKQRIKQQRNQSMKALMKMDLLAQFKKAFAKNVMLQIEIGFDINNIAYKVIRVQQTNNRQTNIYASSSQIQKTQQMHLLKEMNKYVSSDRMEFTTKDLKKKFESQQFFCPISNPYKLKILQKLNSMTQKGRKTNLMLIKIIYLASFAFFLGGSIAFKVTSSNIRSSVVQFQRQAQSLNKQYSYFMQGIFHAYQVHHMTSFPSQFKKYYQSITQPLSDQKAQKFYTDEIIFHNSQKSKLISLYQDAYFDVPIVEESKRIQFEIFVEFFTLSGNSKSTLIYDMVVYLIDTSNQAILRLIALNFNLYNKLIQILRPDGIYDNKIYEFRQLPSIIISIIAAIVLLMFLLIYYLLYQLRDIRQDVITIYTLIDKKEILKNMKKISQISQLIQTLSNRKLTQLKQSNQQDNEPITYSQLNSINNLNSNNSFDFKNIKNKKDSIKTFDQDQDNTFNGSCATGQSQNDTLLSNKQSLQEMSKIHSSVIPETNRINVLIETVINNYTYLLVFAVVVCVLLFQFYSTMQYTQYYISAFKYYQKVRASNFQFRYHYVNAQRYAFYQSVIQIQYVDEDNTTLFFQQTMTNFDFEKPNNFAFNPNQNLCADQNTKNINDPVLAAYSCQNIDSNILQQQFSVAYQHFQRNLRQIENSTYQELIKNQELRQMYFFTIYEFYIFRNYFSTRLQQNFNQNIQLMNQDLNNTLNYQLLASIGIMIGALLYMFIYQFKKLENELNGVISLIKMIPPQTLFSMKVAAIFKKRNILEKLNRL